MADLEKGCERLAHTLESLPLETGYDGLKADLAADPGLRGLVEGAEQAEKLLRNFIDKHWPHQTGPCEARDLLVAALKRWTDG
jgi:hypothetical protein